MRLDKYLSDCKFSCRSETKELVKKGRVRIDGMIAKKSSDNVNEDSCVEVDGERVIYKKFIYLMMNKPSGYLSAVYDKKLPVVTDLLDEDSGRFAPFPVGRLDMDTEGLLILSNDGDFAHRMTSPKKEIYKRYFAVLDKAAEEKDKAVFEEGMDLGDFTSKPARLEICANPKEIYVEICEGKFHQIKRMCEKVGKKVMYLKRVKIGELWLDGELEKGGSRELSEEDLKLIFEK